MDADWWRLDPTLGDPGGGVLLCPLLAVTGGRFRPYRPLGDVAVALSSFHLPRLRVGARGAPCSECWVLTGLKATEADGWNRACLALFFPQNAFPRGPQDTAEWGLQEAGP